MRRHNNIAVECYTYYFIDYIMFKVKIATEELQTPMKEKLAGMTYQRKAEETYLVSKQ